MNWNKKISLLMIVLVILSGLQGLTVFAANSPALDEHAKILNELTILKGSGTSFNLNDQLRRSDAAAFIVKVLGKENTVLANIKQYAYTSYKDVSPDEWYAPYVGYCDQNGIINGYNDGTFKPNDFLSEKAFLKMLLSCLDYGYNVDYTWNTVFYTAYQVGLVQDPAYETKTTDNIKYTRGNVVDALFYALKTQNKKTSIKLIQVFIDTLLISKEKAISYGFITDDIETSIQSISVKSEKVLDVAFNETLKQLKAEDIQIYELNNSTTILKVKEVKKIDGQNKYTITLDTAQRFDVEYVLLLPQIIDQYGNKVDKLSQAFIGYRPSEVVSDFFIISKVEAVNSNVINVYFTQPINDNVIVPSYYSLAKAGALVLQGSTTTMQISKLSTTNKGISITLKNYAFSSEEVYNLSINGKAVSQYGVQLKDGLGDSVKFNSVISQSVPFELSQIVANNSNTIQLSFNKAVNAIIAQQVFSYYITTSSGTPIAIAKAQVDETTGKTVTLTVGTPLVLNQKYNVLINNVNDQTRQFSITEKQYDFQAIYGTTSTIKIGSAYSTDANSIIVNVSQPLDELTANAASSYLIYNVTDGVYMGSPIAVYYNKSNSPLMVKIFLSQGKLLEGYKKYDVRLTGTLKDEFGNGINTIEKFEFNHNSISVVDTYISEAKIIGASTVKLSFSKEIALNVTNIMSNNYSLSYLDGGVSLKKTPISVNYIDPSTVILKFDSLDITNTSTISFGQLTNYAGYVTTNTAGKYNTAVIFGQ